jgi:S-adenosylmethionine decarboxylase
MDYTTLGRHIVADFWHLKDDSMYAIDILLKLVVDSINKSGARIISVQYCTFEPTGLTILVFLEESHFSLHTYPEKEYVAIDCYTCGHTNPELSVDYLANILQPKKKYIKHLLRGDGLIRDTMK